MSSGVLPGSTGTGGGVAMFAFQRGKVVLLLLLLSFFLARLVALDFTLVSESLGRSFELA